MVDATLRYRAHRWNAKTLAPGSLIFRVMGDMVVTVQRLRRDNAPYLARVMRGKNVLISNHLETLPEARQWALSAAITVAQTASDRAARTWLYR